MDTLKQVSEERNPIQQSHHNFLNCAYNPGHLFVSVMNNQRVTIRSSAPAVAVKRTVGRPQIPHARFKPQQDYAKETLAFFSKPVDRPSRRNDDSYNTQSEPRHSDYRKPMSPAPAYGEMEGSVDSSKLTNENPTGEKPF